MDMIVYSTGCPKCKILVKKLQQKEIPFELVDDEEKVMEIANTNCIQSVPFVEYKGDIYLFEDVVKMINAM